MELEERLHQVMKEAVEQNVVAGVNLLVEKDGKELVYCEEGLADREAKKPLRRDSIFRLYSQSKPITAAAAMLLMERGQLDLCQPVGEILPSYEKMTVWKDGKAVPVERPIMVHDLLCMTSGLVYPDDMTEPGRQAGKVFDEAIARLDSDSPMTTMELADRLAAGPLAYMPGQGWQYGTSADILGAVIEKVSGMRFGEFLEKELFLPLGMKDTAFWVPAEKQDRLAKVYETVKDENGRNSMIPYDGCNLAIRNDMAKAPAYEAGGAGLASTLDDYMQFARMLLFDGEFEGKQILHKKTVQYLTGGQLLGCQQESFNKWIGLEGFSYANLMRVCKNPAQASTLACEGEYGWDGWLGAYFANFPKERMTILMGTQKRDAGTFTLTRKLRNVLLSSLL